MSNRMVSSFRIPMIIDPVPAGYASMAFTASRARTEQAVRLGQSFAMLFGSVGAFFVGLRQVIECALEARDLFSLTDAQLRTRGLTREEIPAHIWTRQA